MKQQKTGPAQYRQGDVIIERVSSLPKNVNEVPRENGRVVLANGEVTGHAHVFTGKGAKKFVDSKGREFFEVAGARIKASLMVIRQWRNQVMVRHPKLGVIEFSTADVDVIGDTVNIDGKFELLKHDEHTAHGIPAGFYRGANDQGTVYQREYSPEEIRRVAD